MDHESEGSTVEWMEAREIGEMREVFRCLNVWAPCVKARDVLKFQ